MLLRFEVANHRSIHEPVELSLIAVDEDRPAARSFERLSERVLTVAGIYGPNASGKSNVVDALAWLSAAVAGSLRLWENDVVPRVPFKFGGAAEHPSTFEVDMMVEEVRYTYRLEVSDKEVLWESLHSYPERRRRSLFEREGMEIRFRRGLGSLAGTRELLTPTTLALSATIRFDEPEIQAFAQKLTGIRFLGVPARHSSHDRPRWLFSRHRTVFSTDRLFLDNARTDESGSEETSEDRWGPASALTLLRFADLGIDDVEVVEEPITDAPEGSPPRRRVRLVHRVADQQVPFALADESEGTLTWYRLIGPVLAALRTGRTLLFDEIDASLHPRLSARLIELFQDPETNPRNAQLVFTSHDTSLLNHLNRDEVWLTEKNDHGATTLTALAEYGGDKVRRSLNLEKAYLQGRFGAVPEPDQRLLRHALGMLAQDRG